MLSVPKTLEEVEKEVRIELGDYDVKLCLKKAIKDGELKRNFWAGGKCSQFTSESVLPRVALAQLAFVSAAFHSALRPLD